MIFMFAYFTKMQNPQQIRFTKPRTAMNVRKSNAPLVVIAIIITIIITVFATASTEANISVDHTVEGTVKLYHVYHVYHEH